MTAVAKKNDLVQIVSHKEPSVIGTILQVDEVVTMIKGDHEHVWALLGYVHIPYKGNAYFHIPAEDCVLVGKAVMEKVDE